MQMSPMSRAVSTLVRRKRRPSPAAGEVAPTGGGTLEYRQERDVEALRQLQTTAGIRPNRRDLAAATAHDPDHPPVELTAWPPARRLAALAQSPATHDASCCQSVA